MSVIKYQVIKNGVATNQWLSTDFGADYYEPCFGAKAYTEQVPVLDADGNSVLDDAGNPTFTQVEHPATYEVITTDITHETELALCYNQRLSEYPTVGDQLDAIYKRDHLDDATQWTAIVNQIAATKAKYPKPV
jgi:hypothetical protein